MLCTCISTSADLHFVISLDVTALRAMVVKPHPPSPFRGVDAGLQSLLLAVTPGHLTLRAIRVPSVDVSTERQAGSGEGMRGEPAGSRGTRRRGDGRGRLAGTAAGQPTVLAPALTVEGLGAVDLVEGGRRLVDVAGRGRDGVVQLGSRSIAGVEEAARVSRRRKWAVLGQSALPLGHGDERGRVVLVCERIELCVENLVVDVLGRFAPGGRDVFVFVFKEGTAATENGERDDRLVFDPCDGLWFREAAQIVIIHLEAKEEYTHCFCEASYL